MICIAALVKATDNMVEYEALLCDLWISVELGSTPATTPSCWSARSIRPRHATTRRWRPICLEICKLEDKFEGLEVDHVLRHDNEEVDTLASANWPHVGKPSHLGVPQ